MIINSFIKVFTLTICLGYSSICHSQEEAWVTDFDLAQELSTREGKNILMVFAGSDWCKPCIRFKKNVLQTAGFISFAKDHIQVLYLDFPARKKNQLPQDQIHHNEKLAEKYNSSGAFPRLILFDSSGNYLKDLSYNGESVESFISNLKSN